MCAEIQIADIQAKSHVHHGTRGRGVDGPPTGFRYVTAKEKITPLVESLPVMCSTKMRYILWVAALLGACDVIQDGRPIGHQKLEIDKKR